MITINRPKIMPSQHGWVKLICNIAIDGKDNEVWYSVDNEYAEYLCDDRADAFLLATLPYAMASEQDIEVKGVPVSETMFWRITNEFIPTLARFSKMYRHIKIHAELTSQKYEPFAVGTAFSAGVDSFYTILRNLNKETADHNITHACFFNVGACGYGTDAYGDNAEKVFAERTDAFQQYVSELGLKFVKVNSNLGHFVPMTFNWIHSFRQCRRSWLCKSFSKHIIIQAAGRFQNFHWIFMTVPFMTFLIQMHFQLKIRDSIVAGYGNHEWIR